ncbi:hypothetical protein PSYTB_24900 [Pseudomonas amygdali pv. tabaci str. ATCC 11528]|nr:hypothetical protein PSYTB_24900 [Pseudomonas amygdali pv. tabaci str. ATCC 11528]
MPMLRVGMQFVTLCVTNRRCTARSRADAERPEMHHHAERGDDQHLQSMRGSLPHQQLKPTNQWCRLINAEVLQQTLVTGP